MLEFEASRPTELLFKNSEIVCFEPQVLEFSRMGYYDPVMWGFFLLFFTPSGAWS